MKPVAAEFQQPPDCVPNYAWDICRAVKRKHILADVVLCDICAGFRGHARLARKAELPRDGVGGGVHRGGAVAGREPPREHGVGLQLFMQPWRRRIRCLARRNRNVQGIVVHVNQGRSVLGDVPADGDDRDHRFTDVADNVACKNRAGCRLIVRHPRRCPDVRDMREVGGGEDADDAGQGARFVRVNADDPCMGLVRTDNGEVHHAGQLDVGGITAPTGQQAGVLQPPDGRPDILGAGEGRGVSHSSRPPSSGSGTVRRRARKRPSHLLPRSCG